LLAIGGAEADNCSQFLFLIPELVSVWEATMMKLRSLYADRAKYQRPARCYRPRLECLEGRCVPSTVTNLSDHDPGSLRDAIATTPAGGTVDFQAGLSGTITLTTGELAINKDLTIAGPGADVITVSGNHASRVFDIAATFTVDISGLTIADGSVTNNYGGGIYNDGTLTVSNSTLSGNSAYAGGGIYNLGTLTVSNSTLSGNVASAVGGFGSGIYNGGTLTVSNSTLSGNYASYAGGGIYNDGTLTVISSTFSGNEGIGFLYGSGGGGIANKGSLTISNSTLSGNVASPASSGGGILNLGTLTVSNCTLSGNVADYGGGGIDNSDYGTLTVSNSTLSGNSADDGGGIANAHGTVTVSNSTLSGNLATWGGGIANLGTLTVSNSTLSGNFADLGGGGISTADDNPPHSVTLTNVTLTANRANSGGGLSVGSGSPVLHDTLIAGNFRGLISTTPDDVGGNLDPGGDYNLIGDGTGMTGLVNGVNGNQVGSADAPIDPLLGPLQDNGGPTFTHALLGGSPAIDAGNNAYATDWDQRGPGYPRIVNGIIDIGAFEYQGDRSRPSASGEARGRPILATVVLDLPPRAAFTPILSSATFPGEATIASVTRGVAPRWEEVSVPSAIVEDPRLTSVHEKAPGPMAALWPDPGPLQWSWPNPDVFSQEAELAR
jgi:hypothetical protein